MYGPDDPEHEREIDGLAQRERLHPFVGLNRDHDLGLGLAIWIRCGDLSGYQRGYWKTVL